MKERGETSKYIRIYEKLFPDDPILPEDSRRSSIIAEMRAVAMAKTEEKAAAAIEWWGWDWNEPSLTKTVRTIRKLAKEG